MFISGILQRNFTDSEGMYIVVLYLGIQILYGPKLLPNNLISHSLVSVRDCYSYSAHYCKFVNIFGPGAHLTFLDL